jgi:hypothetical protein
MKTKIKICAGCGKEFKAKYNIWKGYQTFCSAICGQRKLHEQVLK